MKETQPTKETIAQGELLFLWHPGTQETFSGYGLTMQPGSKDLLVGLLMVDRPTPADPAWLHQVAATFGHCELVPMTVSGERGLVCQMQIEPESLPYLRPCLEPRATAMKMALEPLLDRPPEPVFTLRWDEEVRAWRSQMAPSAELPEEIKEVFSRFGHGCLATQTNIGVVHVCHTTDTNIEGFADKPVLYQWQLIKMPTAPLIRLDLAIMDIPATPYRFESFLNVAEPEQARVLAQLANQDQLYLAFFGDDLAHRFTKTVNHDREHWQYIDELVSEATSYWNQLPPERRDFDRAKAEFMSRFG